MAGGIRVLCSFAIVGRLRREQLCHSIILDRAVGRARFCRTGDNGSAVCSNRALQKYRLIARPGFDVAVSSEIGADSVLFHPGSPLDTFCIRPWVLKFPQPEFQSAAGTRFVRCPGCAGASDRDDTLAKKSRVVI